MNNKRTSKRITPLPFIYYYIPIFIIALAGFFDSIYLAVSHYRVHTDLGYSSFCAVSRALNCDTVSTSQYAVFLNIPVAIWGVIGYLFIISLVLIAGTQAAQKARLWPVIFWTALIYSLGSLILASVSTFLIHSYCIMCIVTYLVNFALLYYAWFVNKRYGNAGLLGGVIVDARFLWSLKKIFLPIISGFLILICGLIIGMPNYWEMKPPSLNKDLPTGITEDGHPWIGAENPEIVIVEFTDYLCTQCRIKHFYLRRLIAENPGKIRMIHRHFPMDHIFNPLVKEPYHIGSGTLALFSIYAAEHGAFWKANDKFFQMNKSTGAIGSKKIANMLNLDPRGLLFSLSSREIINKLQNDIKAGLDYGITGTPGYVINGEVYQGYIPPKILKEVIK